MAGLGIGSIAVGFAFKDIFENFFAGVLLLWRFPFERGDFIECNDVMGKVENMTVRSTLLREPSGELIVVPNATLYKNPVYMLIYRSPRRQQVVTGVALRRGRRRGGHRNPFPYRTHTFKEPLAVRQLASDPGAGDSPDAQD